MAHPTLVISSANHLSRVLFLPSNIREKADAGTEANEPFYAYDKVIMLAGGVGYGTKRDCLKGEPQKVTRWLWLVATTIASDWVAVQCRR